MPVKLKSAGACNLTCPPRLASVPALKAPDRDRINGQLPPPHLQLKSHITPTHRNRKHWLAPGSPRSHLTPHLPPPGLKTWPDHASLLTTTALPHSHCLHFFPAAACLHGAVDGGVVTLPVCWHYHAIILLSNYAYYAWTG